MKLFLYFLWILINFKPIDIFFQNICWYIYKIEIPIYLWLPIFLRNQGLVNLGFDDNKIKFKTNDYISSVIRQDNFQSGNHKDKSSQWEIMKKNITSKRRVFQDQKLLKISLLGCWCTRIFVHYILYLCIKIIQELFCFKYFKIR